MTRHGHTKGYHRSKEWRAWNGMIRRCRYPSMQRFPRYGGRGIQVCQRWTQFENFFADIGPAPSPTHSIGRFDHNKNYEIGNVAWQSPEEQKNYGNSRNRILALGTITLPLYEWALRLKVRRTVITQRIDSCGWTVERALTTPKRRLSKRH